MTDAKANLRKNFDWYYANLDSLLPEYSGRYIAFSDGKVIGAFDDFLVAAQSAIDRGHPLGTFAVHKCIPKNEEKPLVFGALGHWRERHRGQRTCRDRARACAGWHGHRTYGKRPV